MYEKRSFFAVHFIVSASGILKYDDFYLKFFSSCLPLFYIHGSVHRESILIRSNKMQQYAGIYLLQNHSTCSGCPSHSSPGVHKTVTAASGTGHSIWATTFLQRVQRPRWRKVVAMTCTRGCIYSFMCSWWWVRWAPETCRVILQSINTCILLHLVGSTFLQRGQRPRWRKVVAQILWPVPEAAVTVLCTPDDGCDAHRKHVEWFCTK